MPTVEQTGVIDAPLDVVMEALNDVATIPNWATVQGTIDHIQGQGAGMTYEWHYSINNLSFSGKSEVLEQSQTVLVTRTSGDIDSLWSIKLAPAGKNSTTIRVVMEYTHPNTYIELLADLVLDQLNDPEVARQNMMRFKRMVEARARTKAKQFVANP